MDAIFKMMNAATRLEITAKDGSEALLRKTCLEVAADLMATAEKAAPKWGELTGLIRDLEKGK